jgi:hypothetical protein
MLYVFSANVRPGKLDDLQRWFDKNRQAFVSAHPKNWSFQDAYLTVFGLGDAQVELHWQIENYAALDEARAATKGKGDYFKFLNEIHGFLDPTSGRGRILTGLGEKAAVAISG